jgi:hypothetical protein
MPTDPSHPTICRENALNALIEIRSCYSDLRTFVAGAFDRLDTLAKELGTLETGSGQRRRKTEQEMMQEQIDQLTRLASELALSVAEQKRLTFKQNHAQSEEVKS